MKIEEAILALQSAPLYFDPRTAAAYVHAGGYCEYCGRELIASRLGYACAQIDHLLPQGRYPSEVTNQPENFVLSCSLCNGTKRDACILKDGEMPLTMLKSHRPELILRAWMLIEGRLKDADAKWLLTQEIFAATSRAPPKRVAYPEVFVSSTLTT